MSITRFVTADGLPAFLAHLSKSARVLAPVEKPGNKTAVVFEPWKEGKPFTLAKATVPAKEAVLPQCEVLVRYSKTKDPNDPGKCTMTLDDTPQAEPTVVFGSRPCDARGYVPLDRPYLHGPFADPYYKARRDQLTVITLTCPSGCSTCFCHWVGGGPTSPEGSDVLMTEVEGGYVLQAMTDKGAALLEGSSLADGADRFADAEQGRLGQPGKGAQPGRSSGQGGRPLRGCGVLAAGDRPLSVLRGLYLLLPHLLLLQHHRRRRRPQRP